MSQPSSSPRFPVQGMGREALFAEMERRRKQDVNWRQGRAFSLVFQSEPEVYEVAKEAYTRFFSENGLNPGAFKSLRGFETDVVAMMIGLLAGNERAAGNMTSGGTESILLAVYTAREWARHHHPHIQHPEIVLPLTAHPAFAKAAHYFGLKLVYTPVRSDFRADIAAMQRALTPATILLVGSAPSYPQGVIDPITEIAELAQTHGLLCHVDACVGGLMLPFVRKLGYSIPEFDFRLPGVTSISADLHKYGYTAKGASVILYRDKALRRYQIFAHTDWPGGIYASPTLLGTRPGGAIAAAWAVMNYLGEDGYLRMAKQVMDTRDALIRGINAIPDLHILSNPDMSVMAIASKRLDVYEVGDEMQERGWHLDRQQFPPSLHMTVHWGHAAVVDAFLRDLAASAAEARRWTPRRFGHVLLQKAVEQAGRLPEGWLSRLTQMVAGRMGGAGLPRRSAAMYGMMGTLPNRGDLQELVIDLVAGFTEPSP